jgi:hypothetical protein
MAGLVNEIRRTDNSGNGFQEQANRAARANRQSYGTLAGRPAEAARVILMCTGNAGWKASAHINVSGHSLPGTHNRDVHAERSHTFTGYEIRSGHYRTLSGGLKRHLKFELSEFEWPFITFWRAVLPTSGQALSASGPGSTVRTGIDGEGNAVETQIFPARAGFIARAHGRPYGVPGRITGAREKSLRRNNGRGPSPLSRNWMQIARVFPGAQISIKHGVHRGDKGHRAAEPQANSASAAKPFAEKLGRGASGAKALKGWRGLCRG